jgi:tRNA threonylcarbamoyladenosine biosynthesis protein TsaB
MTDTLIEKKEPIILAIDTTSSKASMALSIGQNLAAELAFVTSEKRSANLLNEIDWLLARLDLTINDIDAFSVLVGPGSFTGLRVGLATIKGFAHSLNKPIIPFTTTEIVARACGVSEATCVMLNAYRGEVFLQLFSVNESGEVLALSDLTIVKIEQVFPLMLEYQRAENLSGIIFAGDGQELYEEKILNFADENKIVTQKAKFLTTNRLGWILDKKVTFLAQETALYAQEKFALNQVEQASNVAAYYVRPAEAEVKLQLGLIGKKKNRLS